MNQSFTPKLTFIFWFNRRILSLLVALVSFFGYAQVYAANDDIYMCVGANGVKTYSNMNDDKSCKKMNLPGLTVFPSNLPKKEVSKGPSDFPKVDDSTQKKRDGERKQILTDELNTEQQKLKTLNAEYKNGQPDRLGDEKNYAKYQERTQKLQEQIHASEQNIQALQREIGNTN